VVEAFMEGLKGDPDPAAASGTNTRRRPLWRPTTKGTSSDPAARQLRLMLKELADGVPGVQQIVVLSADGLRIARYGGDPTPPTGSPRLRGPAEPGRSRRGEIPNSDGRMRMVIIEINGGYFYLMSEGPTPISRSSPTRPPSPD